MSDPAFELESEEQPRTDERLTDFSDLVGETIMAAFDMNEGGEWVLFTARRNWIVLVAEVDGCCDESASLEVLRERSWRRDAPEVISDFVSPRALFKAGVINEGVFRELQAKADEKARIEREREANALRARLERLEKEGS